MMISLARTEREIAACFETMRELRTHLVEGEFVAQVKAMMAEDYQLAFIEETGRVVCVAGFRVSTNFFLGKHLYVVPQTHVARLRLRRGDHRRCHQACAHQQ